MHNAHRRFSHAVIEGRSDRNLQIFNEQFQSIIQATNSLRTLTDSLTEERQEAQARLQNLESVQRNLIVDAEKRGKEKAENDTLVIKESLATLQWIHDTYSRTILDDHVTREIDDISRKDCSKYALTLFTRFPTDDVFNLSVNVTFKNEDGRGEGVLREFLNTSWEQLLNTSQYFQGEVWKLPSNDPSLLVPSSTAQISVGSAVVLPVSPIRALGRLWLFSMIHNVFPAIHPSILRGLGDMNTEKFFKSHNADLVKFSKRLFELLTIFENADDIETKCKAFGDLRSQFPGLALFDENNIGKLQTGYSQILGEYFTDHILYGHNKFIIQEFLQPFIINSKWYSNGLSSESELLALRRHYRRHLCLDAKSMAKKIVLDTENSTADIEHAEFILQLLKDVITKRMRGKDINEFSVFLTGSTTLQTIYLMIYSDDPRDQKLPVARTCIPRLDISDRYFNSDELYEELKLAIECEGNIFSFV